MPETTHDLGPDPPAGLFATTMWTVVLQAGSAQTSHARPALERLCQNYWYPIYAHVRRKGHSPHDAQDLTQEFFTTLLEREAFQRVSPEKGRFRSFLLAALRHFLADEHDRKNAARRGGGQHLVSLDETTAEHRYALEPAGGETPEKDFDRRWALSVLEHALEHLASEQAAAGKHHAFDQLRPFLTDATEAGDYSQAATALGMTPNTVAVAVRRLRQRYRALVRLEISQTLARSEDLDTEMRHLLDAMRA